MKNLIVAMSFFWLGLNGAFSQNNGNHSKVIAYLGNERFQELTSTNPGLIDFLDAKAEYGYEIIDVIAGKEESFTRIEKVQIHSKVVGENVTVDQFMNDLASGDFNFLLYVFPTAADADLYFTLGDTGKAIVIHSVSYVNSKIIQH